jgi:chromosome segregation ATPase
VLPALPIAPVTTIQPEVPFDDVVQQLKEAKRDNRRMESAIDSLRDDLELAKKDHEEKLLHQRKQHLIDCKAYERALEEELQRHKKQEEEAHRSYEEMRAEMSRLTLQIGALTVKKQPPHYQSPIKKEKKVVLAAVEPPKATPRTVRTKTVYTKQTKKQF